MIMTARLGQIGLILILAAIFLGGCSARDSGKYKLGTMCSGVMNHTCANAHTARMRAMCSSQGCGL